MVILLLFAAAAAQPSPEALRLGRAVAETGTLATLLPLIQQKETGELVSAHPELSPAEQAQLRATADRVYHAARERLMQTEAKAYAAQLSLHDLRAVVAFERSGAGRRHRSALPKVIAATMQQIGSMDFKGDVLAAYCAQTRKLCGK
jgi:hypothetical protein